MRLFSGQPTLEARHAQTESAFTALIACLVTAFGFSDEQKTKLGTGDVSDLQTALETVSSENTQLTADILAANTARTAAETRATTAETNLTDANASLGALRTSLQSALQISDEQLTALNGGDLTVVGAAVTNLATRKAVEIAGGQGCPPVVTAPGSGSGDDDPVATLRQQASTEADPRKRAELHTKANRLADSKKNAATN